MISMLVFMMAARAVLRLIFKVVLMLTSMLAMRTMI